MVLCYFIAGFFVSALPWGPLVAVFTNGVSLWLQSADHDFLSRWWEVSKGHAVTMIARRLSLWIILDTLAMLLANWLRGLV